MGNLITLRRGKTSRALRLTGQIRPDAGREVRQQTAQALGQILRPKLTLGAPDDAQEREADTLADRVMRIPAATSTADGERLQRKCAACQEEDEERVRRSPQPEEEVEEEVQAKAGGAGPDAGPVAVDTASRIQGRQGRGAPLPANERAFFEPRFGADFSRVRLHTDPESAGLAGQLSARAFTVGNDVFMGQGEYSAGDPSGRYLLAHELTHVLQQRGRDTDRVSRWSLGPAPAPYGWQRVTDAKQQTRLDEAEDIVRGVVGSRNCQNYFRNNCSNAGGANTLRNAFNSARVYLRPVDDNIFGEGEFGGNRIAFNLRAYRIGRYMMASTLLHEMFHNCDPTGAGTGNPAELDAENAVETCRLHTPWIDTVTPRSGAAGTRVTIRGWGFGPTQGGSDRVRIGGVNATVVSWTFMAGTSSGVEIVAEVPAGAASGDLVVVNNNVSSNAATFRVV